MALATVLERWLAWLDSPSGLEHRKSIGDEGNDYDLIATIPNPPGKAIVTVGDLRELVGLLRSGPRPTDEADDVRKD